MKMSLNALYICLGFHYLRKMWNLKSFFKLTRQKCNFLDCTHTMAQGLAESFKSDKNLKDKIERLCKNLDTKSINCVNRTISRLVLMQGNKKWFNITKGEREKLKRLEREFYPNIIKVGENCYFYGGYFLPKRIFEVGVFFYNHCLDMIENKAALINKNIIDVGGFIGDSALILSKYTNKSVYSFEAVSDNYEMLLKTIELNNAQNIVPLKNALGAECGSVEIAINGGGSSIDNNAKNAEIERVSVITLDSFVKEHNLEVGFIKVDIEGYEMEFLKGALETIKTQKPAMLLSIYHKASDFFEIKPFLESLNLGYKFKICKLTDGQIATEILLFCEVR
ncbi:MAG: FkbM family methyltransferase [Helicobacteraceae bacterium]|nr:FkbM family methyltransferase [Helicobacteraceae bacterium]